MKRRKSKKLIVWMILIVIAVIMAIVFVPRIITKSQLRQQLKSGNDYLLLGELSKAKQAYKKALAIDPESVEAYLGLAEIYIEEEQYDRAREQLEKGYSLTGEYALERKIKQVSKKIERRDEGLSIISPTPVPTIQPTVSPVPTTGTPELPTTVSPVPTTGPSIIQNPTTVPTEKPSSTPYPTAAIPAAR